MATPRFMGLSHMPMQHQSAPAYHHPHQQVYPHQQPQRQQMLQNGQSEQQLHQRLLHAQSHPHQQQHLYSVSQNHYDQQAQQSHSHSDGSVHSRIMPHMNVMQAPLQTKQSPNLQDQSNMPAQAGPSSGGPWDQMMPEADWPEDDDDRDEMMAASVDEEAAQKVKGAFACPHCDKSYKGKHARSIWRRHLQDKHGIPLSVQPRRTRWDADANRPKNAEERRERMLESKRRWARKKRAQDKLDARKAEGGETPASSPEESAARSNPNASSSTTLSTSVGNIGRTPLNPQALFDGSSRPSSSNGGPVPAVTFATVRPASLSENGGNDPRTWLPIASSSRSTHSSTLGGAFGSPMRGLGEQQRRDCESTQPPSPTSGIPAPVSLSTPSRVSTNPSMARSTSNNGSARGATNPFSLDHHKISPQTRTRGLAPVAPGQALLDVRAADSPSRSGLIRAKQDDGNAEEAEGAPLAGSVRRVLPPLVGTPMRPSSLMIKDGVNDSMFLLRSGGSDCANGIKSSVSRGSGRHDWRSGGLGGSSDDENNAHPRGLSSGRRSAGNRGSERNDDLDSFDDSGICLPQFTPFHKSISRATLGASTPGGALLDGAVSLAFPRTVGRPTPLRRRKVGNGSTGDGDELEISGGDQFSSPHHPNLAHSLGLAPQSALRSTGSGAYDYGGISATPFHHGQSGNQNMLSLSLGFTPFDKGGMLGGSLGTSPGGILWPESVRRPLASAASNVKRQGATMVGAGTHSRRSSDEDQANGTSAMIRDGDKENVGLSTSSSSGANGRYLPSADETPSKPSSKHRMRLSGRPGTENDGRDDLDEDGENSVAIVPLRFNKPLSSMNVQA